MYAAERHFHKRRLCTPQYATSINGDCVDFLTTHLSLVHVITPDDLIGTVDSAYDILLGRPALNRLRAVPSTRHMKMKLPDLSGKVIVIKSDQEEARKCYESSLKKRSVVMVIERPPVSDSPVELEALEEATPRPQKMSQRRQCPMQPLG